MSTLLVSSPSVMTTTARRPDGPRSATRLAGLGDGVIEGSQTPRGHAAQSAADVVDVQNGTSWRRSLSKVNSAASSDDGLHLRQEVRDQSFTFSRFDATGMLPSVSNRNATLMSFIVSRHELDDRA